MNEPIVIESVNIGTPAFLGDLAGKRVYSSINRKPVTDKDELYLTLSGLAGDQSTDTSLKGDKQIHGGHQKAVYAFPSEHLAAWGKILKKPLNFGVFGENLDIKGLTEDTVFPGDQLSWGEALLEVMTPRQPCYKLGMHLGQQTPRLMQKNGMCGWYLRVLRPGVVPVKGSIIAYLNPAPTRAHSIADLFAAKVRRNSRIPGLD